MEFITINSANVDKMRHKLDEKRCFIKFWMDGCGHCIQMAPEWERMKRDLSKGYTSPGKKVAILDIDAPSSSKIPAGRQVVGFPTIMHTLDGTVLETYDGPRTADAMRKWILSSSSDIKRKNKDRKKTRRKKKQTRSAKKKKTRSRK